MVDLRNRTTQGNAAKGRGYIQPTQERGERAQQHLVLGNFPLTQVAPPVLLEDNHS